METVTIATSRGFTVADMEMLVEALSSLLHWPGCCSPR